MEIDIAKEHLYLVERGVRPLALAGRCPSEPVLMLKVATKLETLAAGKVVPFVVDRGDGFAEYGFASTSWIVDLFRWAVEKDGPVPDRQRDRITGLLLGYSAEAIARFEDCASGRCFDIPIIESVEQAAS